MYISEFFSVSSNNYRILSCVAGYEPISSSYNNKNKVVTAEFERDFCIECTYNNQCPVKVDITSSKLIVSRKILCESFKDSHDYNSNLSKKNRHTKNSFPINNQAIVNAIKGFISNDNYQRAVACYNELALRSSPFHYKGSLQLIIYKFMFDILEKKEVPQELIISDETLNLEFIEKFIRILESDSSQPQMEILDTKYYYCLCIKDYKNALNILLEYKPEEISDHSIRFFDISSENISDEILLLIEKLAKNCIKNQFQVILLSEILIRYGRFLPAYNLVKSALPYNRHKMTLYSQLVFICSILGSFKDSERYYQLGMEETNSYNSKDQMIKNFENSLRTNLGVAYNRAQEYQKTIDLLSPYIKNYPNNSDFCNLANAYYKLKKYEVAIDCCYNALLITESETEYTIMAHCLYHEKKFLEAIDWYKKAIAFLEFGNEKTSFSDNQMLFDSYTINADIVFIECYSNLIYCYINLNRYEEALKVYYLAIEKYPNNSEIEKMYTVIDNIAHIAEKSDVSEKMINEMRDELLLLHQKNYDIIHKVKQFSKEIMTIQNSLSIDIDDSLSDASTNYDEIFEKMHTIATQICNDFRNRKENFFKRISNDINDRYSELSQKSRNFLITAEFIYTSQKEMIIDFAPVIVEYCKVIENELNWKFKDNALFSKNRTNKRLTLGNIKYIIDNMNIRKLSWLSDDIGQILYYRNGSAHIGFADVKKAERIRNIIVDHGMIDRIYAI
jgi:pentatricopeptide repeat protein